MGYSYVRNIMTGRQSLVCDNCGASGKTRKITCPAHWCPAPAYCPACLKLRGGSKTIHSECAEKSKTYYKDWQKFREDHARDFVTLAAWGSGLNAEGITVPDGQVAILAGLGGRRTDWQYPDIVRWFLVPEKLYKSRMWERGYVVDRESVAL